MQKLQPTVELLYLLRSLSLLLLSVTLNHFLTLSHERQLETVYTRGTYVARLWLDEWESVLLYAMPGRFFVELTHDADTNAVHYLFPFAAGSEDDRLEDFAASVRLPQWATVSA
jgi:hypothetical protein